MGLGYRAKEIILKQENNYMCNVFENVENWWNNSQTPFHSIYLGEINPKFISYLWDKIDELKYNKRCHPNQAETKFGFLDLETNNYNPTQLGNDYLDLDLLIVNHAERLNLENILNLKSIGISTILIYKRDEILGIPGIEKKNPFKIVE